MKLLFATLGLLGVSLIASCKKNAPDEHPPIGPGAPKPDAAAGAAAAAAPASTVQLPERARDTMCDGAACLPDIDYATLDGRALLRQELRGKIVLISFWASWCEPCTTEAGGLSGVYKRHHADGFEMIGISLDTADDATLKRFAAHYNLSFPIVRAHDELLRVYGRPQSVPTTMLFGRNGDRVWSMSGTANDVIVEADVAALIRGETIKVTRTGTSPAHPVGADGGAM